VKLVSHRLTLLTYLFRLALKLPPSVDCSTETWLHVWNSARQAISVPSTARTSCHILGVLLHTNHLREKLNGALIENTIFGGSSNGPSALTDTSLLLMTNALRSHYLDNGRMFEVFCLKLLGWLSMRWTLRKLT